MAGSPTVICRRCGSPNAPGDQFCGTCGAFLEWVGEAVGDTAPVDAAPPGGRDPDTASPAPAPGSRDAAPPAEPSVAWPPSTTGPSASAAPRAPVGAAPGLDAGRVACPACGTLNPPTRTFCQSCGTRLAGGTPAAAPAGTVPSITAPTPSALPRTAPAKSDAPKPRPEPTSGGGGIPGWVLVVGALGILVGVVAVVAVTLLGSGGLPSEASSAPSAAATSSAGASAGAETPGETATPAAPSDAGPTTDPVEVEPLPLEDATASSIIGGREKFAPDKAIDGDLTTCWQEGSLTEQGEWIEVSFAPARVEAVVFSNGYQLSQDAYLANRRLRDVLVTVGDGEPIPFRLEDTPNPQRLELDPVDGATSVRIEIVTTYDPEATDYPGSPFDDTALSEIEVLGVIGP